MTAEEREMLLEMPAVQELLAEEREACARLAEEAGRGNDPFCCEPLAEGIAAAIRARGNK